MIEDQKCSCCGGVFHPATGHYWSEKTKVCGPCIREFIEYLKKHMKRKWGKPRASPYDHIYREEDNNDHT